jgi:hypothetical protein
MPQLERICYGTSPTYEKYDIHPLTILKYVLLTAGPASQLVDGRIAAFPVVVSIGGQI